MTPTNQDSDMFSSKLLRRLSSAAVLSGVGLCAWVILRAERAPLAALPEDRPVGPAAEREPGALSSETLALREPIATPATRGSAEPREPAPGDAGRVPHHDPIAERMARLEELARTPATFHARAWPVVEELTELCAALPATPDDAGERTREVVLDERMASVVRDPAAPALVRGAVFLAFAPLLSEPAFAGTFFEWTAGDPGLPLELVRAAALAAARRGEPLACSSRVSLAQLAALPTVGSIALPGVHPMALDRVAAVTYSDALRRWLDAEDARKSRFAPSSSPPPAGEDGTALAEYFVTSEVLFCVWSLQCLVDPAVEAAVVAEALTSTGDGRSLVCLRAASFVVRSLALCSPGLYEAAAQAAASSDRIVASIARELERTGIGGIGVGLTARIEALRYSPEATDEAELVKILVGLGKSLGPADGEDAERDFAVGYLKGLVSDVAVSELARASALTAIAEAGSWSELQDTARLAVRRTDDEMLAAIALNSILARGEEHDELRAEALSLLRDLEPSVPPGLRKSVDRYIARLDR